MRFRSVFAMLVAVVATFAVPSAAQATPCPAGPCITISGRAVGPYGEAVPQYRVLVQRADGYNVAVATDTAGAFSVSVPLPTTASQCYQIVGEADAFYANSTVGKKACATESVTLLPRIRSNSFSSHNKQYFPDASQPVTYAFEVSALSRSYPAVFHNATMPWGLEHHDPLAAHDHTHAPSWHRQDHSRHHAADGTFAPPTVRRIADGVWQYVWSTSFVMAKMGFYDFEWGRDAIFNPMMECKMVWFGFGTDSITPSETVPGRPVTITGRNFGDVPSRLILKGSGQVTTIEGAGIVSWSSTSITFIVPPLAKSGWVSVQYPSRIETNAQYLDLDPTPRIG